MKRVSSIQVYDQNFKASPDLGYTELDTQSKPVKECK